VPVNADKPHLWKSDIAQPACASISGEGMLRKSVLLPLLGTPIWVFRILVEVDMNEFILNHSIALATNIYLMFCTNLPFFNQYD
jgi:hypothetical protein